MTPPCSRMASASTGSSVVGSGKRISITMRFAPAAVRLRIRRACTARGQGQGPISDRLFSSMATMTTSSELAGGKAVTSVSYSQLSSRWGRVLSWSSSRMPMRGRASVQAECLVINQSLFMGPAVVRGGFGHCQFPEVPSDSRLILHIILCQGPTGPPLDLRTPPVAGQNTSFRESGARLRWCRPRWPP